MKREDIEKEMNDYAKKIFTLQTEIDLLDHRQRNLKQRIDKEKIE